jgi:hypothetical protein
VKKILLFLLAALMLAGCKRENLELEQMMAFRAALLSGSGCSFEAVITADYQEELYLFTLECRCDEQGTIYFKVQKPESIAGISGVISSAGGKLTFDNAEGLAFETLADGQVTPVTAPWLFIKALRSGYVTSCGMEEDMLRASIDDSYKEDALRLDVWFVDEDIPYRAEILWADRRILSLEVTNFEIL